MNITDPVREDDRGEFLASRIESRMSCWISGDASCWSQGFFEAVPDSDLLNATSKKCFKSDSSNCTRNDNMKYHESWWHLILKKVNRQLYRTYKIQHAEVKINSYNNVHKRRPETIIPSSCFIGGFFSPSLVMGALLVSPVEVMTEGRQGLATAKAHAM